MLNNEAISALRDTIAALNLLLEQKERRVRTPEGQSRFGQPIGSVIVADGLGSVSTPEAELATDLVDYAFDALDKEFGPREISAADNESAWYAVMTDEALSIFDRRAAHPERYNPSGQPGYGLRDGETELRLVRQPGPPRVADYETHTSAGLTMSEAIEVEGFIGMGASGYGKPLVPVSDPRPPKHVYRVMSVGEWEQAKERGYFKSDERMNLATDEGTVASLTTTGSFYVPPDGSDYRIVRIKYEDSDGWVRDEVDGYIKTQGKIPFERVDLVTEPLKNPRRKDEPVEDALPGMDDPYLLEQSFEDDGQGVLPGMPEKIRRAYIKIVGEGANTSIDYKEFGNTVEPYKPTPISVKSVIRREERDPELLAIEELDVQAQFYETDTAENGGLLTNALSAYSGSWLSPSKAEERRDVKVSVNEQITRRIMDHAAANPEFMGWLDNYEYESKFTTTMRGPLGNSLRLYYPELKSYIEEVTEEEYNLNRGDKDKVYWTPIPEIGESQTYYALDLTKVPAETKKEIAKISMLGAVLSGTINPNTGGEVNLQDVNYLIDKSREFSYPEVVTRFLTRGIIDKWASTSGDHDRDAVMLQQIAMSKFGLEDVSTDSHLGMYDSQKYKEVGVFYEVFVDATYENTQDFFRENGIKYVNAYRGMKWEPDSVPDWATNGYVDIEQRINDRVESDLEYFTDEYISENESEINDETQQELDSDFDDFWRGREDEFWEDAEFDVEEASEREKDEYRDEKRQEYYERYWESVRDRVEENWRENARMQFFDYGRDSEAREEVMNEAIDEMRPTGTIKVESQPLSSWSTHEGTADDFAGEGGFYGLVVSGRIPVERIFCTTLTGLGCLNEAELVVLGDYDELTVQ